MKWTTSWASAASNVPSGNGSCSADARRTSAPGLRARAAATNGSDGSTAATAAGPSRSTSSAVSAPGPQPTSIARWPRLHAGEVGQLRGQVPRVPPHEAVVGLGGDVEGHPTA